MSEEDIIFGIQEMIEFSRLTTDIGFADQSEKITLLEETLNLIEKQRKEIDKQNMVIDKLAQWLKNLDCLGISKKYIKELIYDEVEKCIAKKKKKQ